MSRDVLDQLAAARPARLDPPPADVEGAVAAIVRAVPLPAPIPARSRRRVAVFASAGLTAAAAITGIAVVVTSGTAPTPGPSAGPTAVPRVLTAGQILLAAAERSGATTFGTGRYLVQRNESGVLLQIDGGTDTYAMLEKTSYATWLSRSGKDPNWASSQRLGLTPATPADAAAHQRHGSPQQVMVIKPVPGKKGPTSPVGTGPGERFEERFDGPEVYAIGADNVTVADLEKLPTDPAKLRAELLRHFRGGGGDLPTDRDEWLLVVGSSVVTGLPVSGQVRAAAYRMIASLPGVRALGTVRDQRDRAGEAVAFTRSFGANGAIEERLIIDPKTGQGLARESRVVKPGGSTAWLEAGVLYSYELTLAVETADVLPG